MESVDLLAKQENEGGPKTLPENGAIKTCFVCQKPVLPGQQYYYLNGNATAPRRRHVTCARKSPGVVREKPSNQQIPLAVGRIIKTGKSL